MASFEKPLYLGLDLSTQQLKAILITDDLSVKHEIAVHFDHDLGQKYGVTNGSVKGPDEGEVTSPVAMWIEAIDLLMQRMKDAGVDFGSVSAISGAGQVSLSASRIKLNRDSMRIFGGLNSNTDQYIGRMRRNHC
jgi:xylulokinase